MTNGGNLKKVDIAAWVKQSWLELQQEMIVRSFKKFCISNAMDRTQDDTIFEEDGDNNELDPDDIPSDLRIREGNFKEFLKKYDNG